MSRTYDDWKTTDPRDMEPPEKPERDPDAEYDAWRDEMLGNIITSHVKPPIPIRTFDWSACLDGDEEVADRLDRAQALLGDTQSGLFLDRRRQLQARE